MTGENGNDREKQKYYLKVFGEAFMYYVYFLSNQHNNVLYIGVTNDLIRRVYEHKSNAVDGFTKKYKVDKLVYYEQTSDVYSAISREKQVKGWKRDKKNELVNGMNPVWKDLYPEIIGARDAVNEGDSSSRRSSE